MCIRDSPFQARWHPELRPNLVSRFFGALTTLSPFGVMLALWFQDKILLITSLLVGLRWVGWVFHRWIGKVIFPAQLIAKRSWGCTRELLISVGLEESLLGAAGEQELQERKHRLMSQFGGQPVQIMTADGIRLDAALFAAPNSGLDGPTVIYFNANMQLFEAVSSAPLIRMYFQHNVNVLLFNYRGVGASTGHVTRDGVLIDAESVYQFVRDCMRVPEHQIVLHARSIGGGIACALARLHPAVALCSERSFASLSKVIRMVLAKGLGVWVSSSAMTLQDEIEASSGCCMLGIKKLVLEACMCFVSLIGWHFEGVTQAYLGIRGHKLSLIHISEPTRLLSISYAVFCLKKKKKKATKHNYTNTYRHS
eukprot:TRINITY_DN43826_c0_g1_i2.p1 TRINITY_DN43826_c0_g1~~TRINITY_DN43826_c0_g1_i2.p1  ORF type:complete len:367 (+),score=62.58 TRINITY_DN43826_c0_g1_i2:124-1224(+)